MKLSGATGTAEDEHGTADDEPPVEARGGTFDRILYSLTELRRGKCGELGNLRKRRDVRRLCAALYFITMMAVLVSFLGSGGHAGISVGENPIGILGKDPSISKLSSTLSKQHFSNMNSKAETPSSSIGILGLKDQSQLSSTLSQPSLQPSPPASSPPPPSTLSQPPLQPSPPASSSPPPLVMITSSISPPTAPHNHPPHHHPPHNHPPHHHPPHPPHNHPPHHQPPHPPHQHPPQTSPPAKTSIDHHQQHNHKQKQQVHRQG